MTIQTIKNLNFGYYINLNERGSFNADVRDMDGKTLLEVASDEDGEVWQVEDGFMKDCSDVSGLTEYAVSAGILPAGAQIHSRSKFERMQEEWGDAISVIEQFDPQTKLADLYDDNEDLADALDTAIPTFEYPDHSHKTIAVLLAELVKQPEPEPKKSASMRMG
jgi:hypothetical protein